MRLISWNVNGLRACLGKGFLDYFKESKADIFCIQETKMQKEQAEVDTPGYFQYWNSAEKKGYSGTAVFTKEEPLDVTYGLGLSEHDTEGRVITCRCLLYTSFSCWYCSFQSSLGWGASASGAGWFSGQEQVSCSASVCCVSFSFSMLSMLFHLSALGARCLLFIGLLYSAHLVPVGNGWA